MTRDDVVGAAWLCLAAERGNAQAPHVLELLSDVPAGKALGCTEPAKKSAPMLPPKEIAGLVAKIGAEYKINPKLLIAVIATESAFQVMWCHHDGRGD